MCAIIQPPIHSDMETMLDLIRQSDQPILPDKAFLLRTFPELLNRHMGRVGISTDTLFELIGMNRSTGYRILSGQRRPSRDVLIALIIALRLHYQEAQELLETSRMAQLSPRDDRDYLILFAIMHDYDLGETNDLLLRQRRKTLFGVEQQARLPLKMKEK